MNGRHMTGDSGEPKQAAGLRIFKVFECYGCGEPTMSVYRELPLCVVCQQECTLLNTICALPSGPERLRAVREFVVRITPTARQIDIATGVLLAAITFYFTVRCVLGFVAWMGAR